MTEEAGQPVDYKLQLMDAYRRGKELAPGNYIRALEQTIDAARRGVDAPAFNVALYGYFREGGADNFGEEDLKRVQELVMQGLVEAFARIHPEAGLHNEREDNVKQWEVEDTALTLAGILATATGFLTQESSTEGQE